METLTPHDDRRAEPRYNLGGRIEWIREDDEMTGRGYIIDRSDSGVAFITSARLQPRCGDRIQLWPCGRAVGEGRSDTLRICRTEPYDARLTLVACEAT